MTYQQIVEMIEFHTIAEGTYYELYKEAPNELRKKKYLEKMHLHHDRKKMFEDKRSEFLAVEGRSFWG